MNVLVSLALFLIPCWIKKARVSPSRRQCNTSGGGVSRPKFRLAVRSRNARRMALSLSNLGV